MPVKNAIMCFLAALIWGTAFVAQRVGGELIGPYTINGVRFLLGFLVLLPLVMVRKNKRKKQLPEGEEETSGYSFPATVKGGICCGIFLSLASTLQQIAIMKTDVGKAGFLTALYIVMVPMLNLIINKNSEIKIWISVAISLAGLYFLCINGSFYLTAPDLILIACAFVFSLHIMCIDRFAGRTDPIEMSCIQFLTAGIIGTCLCIFTEHPDFLSFPAAGLLSLLYVGVFSSGAAYTLQVLGQRDADPAIASLILSLESVISAIAGFLLLGQVLSGREIIGCALMFAAIILVQLPDKKRG